MRMASRLLFSLVTIVALVGPTAVVFAANEQTTRMAPTTAMEKKMEDIRHELNALAEEMKRIRGAMDAAERRALLRAHVSRMRDAIASMREMEARMHDAVDRGQIVSDRGARERHAFLLDQFMAMAALLDSVLAEIPAPDSARK